ncbi:hypothetical protein JHK82_055190 [Glycine max]|nr:hypothetical protein JHK82_055190 [Glycine max]
MSRNLLLVLFAIPTLLHGSAAQTRHVVGDAMGWIIPPGGATTYTTWASNKTFTGSIFFARNRIQRGSSSQVKIITNRKA